MAAPYQLFRTADGRVFIGAGNDRLFGRVCEALGRPELASDPRFAANSQRVQARAELQAEIDAATTLRSTADLVLALRRAGGAVQRIERSARRARARAGRRLGP